MKNLLKKFRNKAEEISDLVAHIAAKPSFILFHIFWWFMWILLGIEKFPYGLLTLIVSLEAIILSALILSSDHREGDIEKKIARKDLKISTETNMMVEEIHELIRDLHEDIRIIRDDVGDK